MTDRRELFIFLAYIIHISVGKVKKIPLFEKCHISYINII